MCWNDYAYESDRINQVESLYKTARIDSAPVPNRRSAIQQISCDLTFQAQFVFLAT